jgi:elongation factor 2
LYCVNSQVETAVGKVYVSMGAFREEVSQVSAGNIAVLGVERLVKAGETLVDVAHKSGMVPFEAVSYVSEPVVTIAVEPKNPKDLSALLEALEKLAAEDPNLAVVVNRETGEYLLSGMGELHLEVAVKLLREYGSGMEIAASQPRVVYSESVTKKGMVAAAKSPNKQNRFAAQVEPLKEPFIRLIEQTAKARNMGNVLAVDEQHKNVMVDYTRTPSQTRGIADFVASGFEYACKAGPLCGEPLRHVKVNLMEIQLSGNTEYCNPAEIMRGVGKAVFGAVLTAKPVLLEPVYRTVISVPTELAGECSRILGSRRGKLSAFEQKGALAMITGYVPVAETFGLSEELRSATSGRAFWQSVLDRWRKMPEKLAAKVIKETRKRKGLPSEVPKPDKFLEEN